MAAKDLVEYVARSLVDSPDAVRVEELIAADPSLAIFAAVISGDEAKAEALLRSEERRVRERV